MCRRYDQVDCVLSADRRRPAALAISLVRPARSRKPTSVCVFAFRLPRWGPHRSRMHPQRGVPVSRHRGLAVAQTCPRAGDVRTNIREHIELVRLAAAHDAHTIVFPELSLTGYELLLARELAFTRDDSRLDPLIDAALVHDITIVAGAPVRTASKLHIGAYIIGPDESVQLYTKRHLGVFSDAARIDGALPPAERTVFDAGDHDPLIVNDHCIAALAICADVGQPTHPQHAVDRGANTYIASMFVIPSELKGEVDRLQSCAVRHRMVVAFANFACPSGGLAAAGHSTIWDGSGNVIAQLAAACSGVAIATRIDSDWVGSTDMLTDYGSGARADASM